MSDTFGSPATRSVLISVAGFGLGDVAPLERLRATGWTVDINDSGTRLAGPELLRRAADVDAIIAGTEDLGAVVREARALRLITRLGVGVDSVPLQACADRGIAVSCTPTAVAPAVAELTVGLMLAAARGICRSDRSIRREAWERPQGRRIGGARVGLLGFGRIGQRVARNLIGFAPAEVLIHDASDRSTELAALRVQGLECRQCGVEELLETCSIVSVHLPATPETMGLVDERALRRMPRGAVIVNTARGGIVDEAALAEQLRAGHISAAGLDVFVTEPYRGPLAGLDGVVLSAHIGPAAIDCRAAMESEAVDDVISFLRDGTLANPVSLPAPMPRALDGGSI